MYRVFVALRDLEWRWALPGEEAQDNKAIAKDELMRPVSLEIEVNG